MRNKRIDSTYDAPMNNIKHIYKDLLNVYSKRGPPNKTEDESKILTFYLGNNSGAHKTIKPQLLEISGIIYSYFKCKSVKYSFTI